VVRGFAILLLLQFAGEALGRWAGVPIPGNVIGMGLLLLALFAGVVRLEWVQEASDLLLSNFALFFVPAGVGVMVYFDVIRQEWLPIVVATVVSTFAVMAVTGWTEAYFARRGGADER